MPTNLRTLWWCVVLAVTIGCGPRAEEEEAEGAADALAWSPDRFGLSQIAGGKVDYGDAYWMARLSQISYLPSSEIESALGRIGLTGVFASFEGHYSGAHVFYVETKTHTVIVFRGTQWTDVGDLLADLWSSRGVTETVYGGVASGFHDQFAEVWNDGRVLVGGVARSHEGLRSFLFRQTKTWTREKKLVLAGHSLGGSLATIAAAHIAFGGCERRYPAPRPPGGMPLTYEEYLGCRNVEDTIGSPAMPDDVYRRVDALYTFGAARVGDRNLGNLVMKIDGAVRRVWRFSNEWDPVPRLPTALGSGWHPSIDGDEGRSEVALDGRQGTGHWIASYVATLRAHVEPGRELAPDEHHSRAERFRAAVGNATAKLEVVAPEQLPSRARAHHAKFTTEGAKPEALRTRIDGAPAYGVRRVAVSGTLRVSELMLFDTSAYVTTLGRMEDGTNPPTDYVLDTEPFVGK